MLPSVGILASKSKNYISSNPFLPFLTSRDHVLFVVRGISLASSFELRHDKTDTMNVRHEDSDQPGHSPSLIRVFNVAQWAAKDQRFLHADSED